MDVLDSTAGIVAIVAGAIALVALLLSLTLAVRLRRLRRAQRIVLGESGEDDLVGHAATTQQRVEELQANLDRVTATLFERLGEDAKRLDGSISRTAVIRYDAFSEGSGRQSSTVALLDDRDNGVVISAILGREQARVYAKPILGGDSPLDLSPEEHEAMENARKSGGDR